jgi:hypothetical protein
MAFKRPFRAEPMQVGDAYHNELQRQGRRALIRLLALMALVALSVFALGMMVAR